MVGDGLNTSSAVEGASTPIIPYKASAAGPARLRRRSTASTIHLRSS
jgi:hypothetical protein